MHNMVCLARAFHLQHVDVIIEQHQGKGKGPRVDGPSNPRANSDDVVLGRSAVDINDDMDLRPTFCPNNDKAFLSASWAIGFTYIGQQFEGGVSDFLNVLRNKHICGVVICTSKNLLVGSELVADIITERVRNRPLTRPTKVILDLKQDYGLDITYCVAWLGVEKARGELFGAHNISFDQLRWYSDVVLERNPESYINIEYDDHTHRFTRCFISFKACINGFKHCSPLLFLDATFLKGRFKGFLLAATAKDDN
ncbi:hypothetical protein ACSBR1_011168 [Camellia fascicularis]